MSRDRAIPISYAAIAVLLGLLFFPALVWLVRSWLSSPYYSHGFLVPPIAALLAWRTWPRVRDAPRQGTGWPGLALTGVSLVVVVWAMRWHSYALASGALVMLLAGIVLYLEGWARLRHWLFPLFFLLFMVPLPFLDLASPWLESVTAEWATRLAGLAGFQTTHQGGEILLPNTSIVVGAPCSGLRSLVAMGTIGAAWVFVVEGRAWAKTVMLIAILPIVLLSNILRITILLVLAVLAGEEIALSYYHDWSSPILFLAALGLLLLLGKVLGCSRVREDIF